MDYEKIIWLSTLCELVEKILAGEEFVEIRLGTKEIGGINLRVKGNMLSCNLPDVGGFSWEIPAAIMTKAENLLAKLKEKFDTATKTTT